MLPSVTHQKHSCLGNVVEGVVMDILDFLRKGGAFPASVGWKPEPEGALGISAARRKEGQDCQPLTLETAYAVFVVCFPCMPLP